MTARQYTMQGKFSEDYSVITFATNKLTYAWFALNCAQSVVIHNDIKVFVVSNLDFAIPAGFKNNIFIIPVKPEHIPLGIEIKLHVDEYIQTQHTLFIDSDCICFGHLNDIFDAAKGQDVTVAGNIVPAENWCGAKQAKTINEQFNLDKLIRYNGGLYYIKRSAISTAIYQKAREIGQQYDSLGFHRINNKGINEEGPMSIAMMLNNQQPIADNGRTMTDMHTDQRPRIINVLTGERLMRNPEYPSPNHRSWYPAQYSPLILHFGGANLKAYPYRSQSLLLKLSTIGAPVWLATALVDTFIHGPYKTYHWLRGLLRKLKTSL
ncbi:hypothetical protein [Mucilaginibacter panaciglaebae]|uniref:Glycosyl transferase family 8 n=1 Tax=Mucilaginibacter panaciglaebae TaxID=502331 RepID=A0ABP7WBL2_9SPHI